MSKISISQLFAILLLATGLSNHVLVIPILINAAGRDAWLSVIIGYMVFTIFSPVILYVLKGINATSVFDWLTTNYSRFLSRIIGLLFLLFFVVAGWITLKETTMWTGETYLFETPILVVALFLLGTSFYISYGRLNVIAICAGVLLPVVILFGIFVATGTIPDKDYMLVGPILVENSWKDVFKGAIFAFGSIIEVALLLILLQHQITKRIRFKHMFVLILFLCILTAGPLLGSIAAFGVEEAEKMRYPAFFQWQILGLGNYFNHLDFLSIYQWLSGNFIRLATSLFILTQILQIQTKRKRIFIQLFICFFYILFTIAPITDEAFFSFLANYYYIGGGILGVSIIFILTVLIAIANGRRNKAHAKK